MTDDPFVAGPETADAAATEVRIGQGFGLVSERTIAVLDAANGALGEQLWTLVESGADLDDVLEAMSVQGLRSLGAFAMARFEGGAVRVVVRGDATASIEHEATVTDVRAEGVRTWVERVVASPASVTVRLGAPADGPLPYRATRALLPADLLVRRSAPSAVDLAAADPAAFAGFAPPAVAVTPPMPPSAPLPPPAPPAEGTSVVVTADVGPSADEDVEPITDAEGAPTGYRTAASPPTLSSNDVGELREPASGGTPPDDDFDYDALYGATQARSIQRAAMRTEEPSVGVGSDPPPAEQATPPLPAADPERAAGFATGSSGGLIDGVPTGGPAPASVPAHPPLPSPAAAGDFVGRGGETMSREQLAALKAQQGDVTTPSLGVMAVGGPTVLAVPCAVQHPNPPQATVCRVCGAPVHGSPVVVSRPRLGQLRFGNGQVVALDRPLVIGRNPKIDGRPGELPLPLKLDIGQGLSRTHAAIRLEGWQVMIEDLDSANGTVVTLPGRDPHRLRVGEPAPLEHGARIDLGGEITATFESTP